MHRALIVLAYTLTLTLPAAAQTKADLDTIDAWILGGKDNEAQKEAAVAKLLKAKPAVAKGTKDGRPLLAYALDTADVAGDIGRKSRKLAELLIAAGADVNAKVDDKPLIVKYAMFARVAPMELLLAAKGANPDLADKDGRTGLHWLGTMGELDKTPAAVEMTLRAATLLLKRKAKINAKDKRGSTPLHLAAFNGAKRLSELLIERGADINAKDKDGYSVLGACRLRVGKPGKPTFSNSKEKAATAAVIKVLVAKGAKDEHP